MPTDFRSPIRLPYRARLTAAVNASTVTVANVPDLQLTNLTVGRWRIRGWLIHQAAATTTGLRIRFSAAGGLVAGFVEGEVSSPSGATAIAQVRIGALGAEVATPGVIVANTNQIAKVALLINVTTAGNLQFAYASEVAAASILQPESIIWAELHE